MKNINKKKSILADMSLLLVALMWGGGFIAVKGALDSVTPFYITAMRFGISVIIMLLVFRKKIKHITIKELKIGTLVGLLLFLGFAAQTVGMKYTTAGKNAFLTGTNVVIVPFLYWVISKKKPDSYSLVSAFLCFIGIGMLTLDGGINISLGDSLTLLCAVFFAAHIVS
ncbi:MAG: DMT family transporter, partial [Clostridiaceae bacterium]|nr:DMT family transporter [Clostridiaceae bacterium]